MTEPSSSIGTQLRSARESKQWTVQEAARRTKLKRDAIEKMEADEFERFPSLSYARGFVRIYARELGLNGWELMKSFENAPDVPVEGLDLHPEDLEAIPRRKQPPIATSQGIGLAVMLMVVAIALVFAGIKLYQIWPKGAPTVSGATSSEPIPTANPGDGPVRAQPVEPLPVSPAPPEPLPTQEGVARAIPVQPIAPPAEPVPGPAPARSGVQELRLQAFPDTPPSSRYVRVTAFRGDDEVILYDDVLPAGQTLPGDRSPPWRADRFVVLFRETQAVEIIFNGTNFGTYDQPGVRRVTLPAP